MSDMLDLIKTMDTLREEERQKICTEIETRLDQAYEDGEEEVITALQEIMNRLDDRMLWVDPGKEIHNEARNP